MKRASYRAAIEWIALNDEPGLDEALDPKHCAEIVSACLVADIFGVSNEKVGQDIARVRRAQEEAESD